MPHFAVVIDDPDKAHAADIARNVSANLAHLKKQRPAIGPAESAALTKKVTDLVTQRTGKKREVGDLHTIVEDTCPDGLPNCRNCGDPAFEAPCKAAGHCECCGRSADVPGLLPPPIGRGGHGLAPASYLAATGLTVTPLANLPAEGETWDKSKRTFAKP